MTGTEGNLFDLREKFVDRPVQNKFPNFVKWNQILRPHFCSIKDVEVEFMLVFLLNDLNCERPFRISTVVDRLFKILSMEI